MNFANTVLSLHMRLAPTAELLRRYAEARQKEKAREARSGGVRAAAGGSASNTGAGYIRMFLRLGRDVFGSVLPGKCMCFHVVTGVVVEL
jgi:hypothetical protein